MTRAKVGRSNSNERGSSYDRRARRRWLVSPEAGFGGDGTKVPCWECGRLVNEDEVIADREIPGHLGGTYRRSNIRGPHCPLCSCRQGQRLTTEIARQRDPYGDDDTCRCCGTHWLLTHPDSCTYKQQGMV